MRQLVISQQITNRESYSIDKYLQEISKIDLLLPEEEVHLAKQIKQGNMVALEIMVKANLRFVVSVAKQYQHHGFGLSDLINEGNLGLIKAAQQFDESRGFKFISYAVWWIRQSILRALVEYSKVVRMPANKVTVSQKIKRAFLKLEQEFEREPTENELADVLEMQPGEVTELMLAGRQVSMDTPMGEDGESTLASILENTNAEKPDHKIMNESLVQDVRIVLSKLNKREALIVRHFYGLDSNARMSFEEIGDMLGLTRERVRQIKEKALRKMRRATYRSGLRNYLA